MTSRADQREWLADAKAWKPERDAVGIERLVDTLQLIDATGTVRNIDLRRWRQFSPEVTEQLRGVRDALVRVNRLMMETIQDKVEGNQ